ncbi:substrate-binding domain-containing protein [Georgenia muralis]|uniref:Ribose transport system substrate-binding protein n=1 Tax=Georgenia muralis TaxID=154117 RepID=A0A3N5A330_9MICO|nr:substrate-binding domain-containing protein [Georgenia muralis]RPF26241.1 ribose transport system substrate-binding protein [Georgenia muralis]
MRINKTLAAALAMTSALALSACSGGDPAPGTVDDTAAGADGPVIGFSISTLQNPFFVSMEEGVTEAAEAAGIEVTVADASDDASQQANDILNFISQGVDVAILNPTDGDAIISSVEALNEAGIPVITVDRRANGGEVLGHLGTDNVIAGEIAAETLFEAMGGEGKVAILEGVPGASPTIDRGQGFENVLADYPDIEVVGSQTANFQRSEGLSVAQNMLQANPDITGFLAMNDEMALGAIEAMRSANMLGEVKVIGIDGGADAVAAVEAGELVATIAQQSKLMGSMSVEDAIKVAAGETVPEDQPVDVIVIDESNVAEYL